MHPESATDVTVRARLSAGARSFLERFGALYASRDLDALADVFHPAAEVIDHRRIGWEALRGWPAIRDALAAHLALTEGQSQAKGEMLDATPDGDAYLSRDVWTDRLTTYGGGAAESERYVIDVTRDGRLLREEMFDDEHSARAAFAALVAAAARATP